MAGTADESRNTQIRRAVHGRTKGPALRPRQQALVDELLPDLSVTLADSAEPRGLFPFTPDQLVLEIGFGGGEHLVHQANASPMTGFIGAEAYLNGFGKILANISDGELANIRLFQGDALELLHALPDASLDRVDLLYPDPWRKRKHWKRRFVGPDSLDQLARIIKPGGLFRFASDWSNYVSWTLMHVAAHEAFTWTATRPSDWGTPWENWPGTRYEAKAIREGRKPSYLQFRNSG